MTLTLPPNFTLDDFDAAWTANKSSFAILSPRSLAHLKSRIQYTVRFQYTLPWKGQSYTGLAWYGTVIVSDANAPDNVVQFSDCPIYDYDEFLEWVKEERKASR